MSDNILNKDIVIKTLEMTKTKTGNTQYKITDQDGVKFSFFKTRAVRDEAGNPTDKNEDSAVMAQWKILGLNEDSQVHIGYAVKSYTDKTGVERTSNNIVNLQEPKGEVVVTPQAPKPAAKPVTYSKPTEDKPDWEAITRGKVATNLAQGYLAGGKSIHELESAMTGILKAADDLIKLSATFDPQGFENSLEEIQIPVHSEEEVRVEDISF